MKLFRWGSVREGSTWKKQIGIRKYQCLDQMSSSLVTLHAFFSLPFNVRDRLKKSYKQNVLAHSYTVPVFLHSSIIFWSVFHAIFEKKLGSHIKLWCLRHSFKAKPSGKHHFGSIAIYCYQTTSFHMVFYPRCYAKWDAEIPSNSWFCFGCFEVTQHSAVSNKVSSRSLGSSIMSGRASGLSEPAGASSDRGLVNWDHMYHHNPLEVWFQYGSKDDFHFMYRFPHEPYIVTPRLLM